MTKEIHVYANWEALGSSELLGLLRAERVRGEEIFSFTYAEKWLASHHAQTLDPDLNMYAGPQYLQDDKQNFGLFLDSSPDRWGRTLMKRREAIRARSLRENPRMLLESDFLLGIDDETRMGALRFTLEPGGVFLAHHKGTKVPPITSIRELAFASRRIEDDDFISDSDAQKWLNLLMAPGSSLGGARPKASVRDVDGSLWIAKFPSKNDVCDTGAWELLANRLAAKLDIRVAHAQARTFSHKQHTFLSQRFDRSKQGNRIHFASAMTLLGYKDGHNFKAGASYLELVELIERYGNAPLSDLQELWKRIVFSVAISNTDDHLRNHGFLLTSTGWVLSPAYDINPNENGQGLSLNISEDDNSLDFELCLSVCEYFRWDLKSAKAYVARTKREATRWPEVAKELGISASERNYMEPAFRNI